MKNFETCKKVVQNTKIMNVMNAQDGVKQEYTEGKKSIAI